MSSNVEVESKDNLKFQDTQPNGQFQNVTDNNTPTDAKGPQDLESLPVADPLHVQATKVSGDRMALKTAINENNTVAQNDRTYSDVAIIEEKLQVLNKALEDLFISCEELGDKHKPSKDFKKQLIDKYTTMISAYTRRLDSLGQKLKIQPLSYYAVAKLQSARKRTSRIKGKRELAARGSPAELFAQLKKMGISQQDLDSSFKKMYESISKSKSDDYNLNLERAKVLLLDAFESRNPDHILNSIFEIKLYRCLTSWYFNVCFSIIAVAHLALVMVEHNGYGLLSKNPDKYMLPFDVVGPLEMLILFLYFVDSAIKIKLYKTIRPWDAMYAIIVISSIIDLLYAWSQKNKDPRKVMRLTRAFRPYFLCIRWRTLRNMVHEILTAIKKLIPVLIMVAFYVFVWALFGIMLFPRFCGTDNKMPKTCTDTTWISRYTPYNASTVKGMNNTSFITVKCEQTNQINGFNKHLCKSLKTIPSARYSQTNTYFQNISMSYMELLYLLFGSVNYPDVQLPAQLTINIFFLLYFVVFLIIGIMFLNMMLAQVFEGWKEGAGSLLMRATKRQRVALIECFILMDKDSSGSIDFSEFKTVISSIRPNENRDLFKVIFSRLDKDENNELDLDDFMNICDELWLDEKDKEAHLVQSEFDLPETLDKAFFSEEVIDQWHRAREYRRHEYKKYIRKYKDKRCHHVWIFLDGGLLPSFRVILRQSWFEISILFVLVLAAVSFFGEIYYTVQCDTEQKIFYNTLEWIALSLLLIETAIKILAVGFRGFLSVTTWKMDAFFVFAATTGQFMRLFTSSGDYCSYSLSEVRLGMANILRFFALLRLIRVFRFLSSRKSLPGSLTSRVMYKTFRSFVPNLVIFLLMYFCLLYVYAIVGMYYLGGKLHNSNNTTTSENIGGLDGAGAFSITTSKIVLNIRSPYLTAITFDTFVGASFALWSVTIMNNWHLVHYAYANSPQIKGDVEVVMVTIYFVSWILLSAMVWLNLLVSAFLDRFSRQLKAEKQIAIEHFKVEKQKMLLANEYNGKFSRYIRTLNRLWIRFILFCEESLGTTKICKLSGKAMSGYLCPNIILPSVFYSMEPVPISVTEFLKLCNSSGKMRNKRFTKLYAPSVKNLLDTLKQETADDSLILIRQKSKSGSFSHRDSRLDSDRLSLLSEGEDLAKNETGLTNMEMVKTSTT